MEIRISITANNDAFLPDCKDEIARIIQADVLPAIESSKTFAYLRDKNGNTVGYFKATPS